MCLHCQLHRGSWTMYCTMSIVKSHKFFKILLTFYFFICVCFSNYLSGHSACGILVSDQGLKPWLLYPCIGSTRVLTTGPAGKFQHFTNDSCTTYHVPGSTLNASHAFSTNSQQQDNKELLGQKRQECHDWEFWSWGSDPSIF